ncbi:hypothetical protein V5799_012352 [Amblyomma americanum]|uniref:Uncharacterized protein n=1 Tax=Amblyomma americanum TaxID=6943 RepID=A0AAQ4EE86_AMBAM
MKWNRISPRKQLGTVSTTQTQGRLKMKIAEFSIPILSVAVASALERSASCPSTKCAPKATSAQLTTKGP